MFKQRGWIIYLSDHLNGSWWKHFLLVFFIMRYEVILIIFVEDWVHVDCEWMKVECDVPGVSYWAAHVLSLYETWFLAAEVKVIWKHFHVALQFVIILVFGFYFQWWATSINFPYITVFANAIIYRFRKRQNYNLKKR